jgi:hypothetical protein
MPFRVGGLTPDQLAFVPEVEAGVAVAELAELESPPLADLDSLFVPDLALVSVPVFFSAAADSEAELLPPVELPFAA